MSTEKQTGRRKFPRAGKIHVEHWIDCGDCGTEAPLLGASRPKAEHCAMRDGWAKLGDPWWRCPACALKIQQERAA